MTLGQALSTSSEGGSSSLTPLPDESSFKCCPYAMAFLGIAALIYLMKRK